ncbi:MAG: amidohydrolase family protein, partial [Pseudomonadota bacterium]
PVLVGVGTDMGAGDCFSILQVLDDAYKVAEMQDQKLSALKGLYLATTGGAKSLHLEDEIGSFDPGKFADLVVLDMRATPVMRFRAEQARIDDALPEDEQAFERLRHEAFGMMVLGDERNVDATYVSGELLYQKSARPI